MLRSETQIEKNGASKSLTDSVIRNLANRCLATKSLREMISRWTLMFNIYVHFFQHLLNMFVHMSLVISKNGVKGITMKQGRDKYMLAVHDL